MYGRLRRALPLALALVFFAPRAWAQLSPNLLLRHRLGGGVPQLRPKAAGIPETQGTAKPTTQGSIPEFVLRKVALRGNGSMPLDRLAVAWRGAIGHPVTGPLVAGIMAAMGRIYAGSGVALYAISLPPQNFAGGVLAIQVTEGYVAGVTIEGNVDGAPITLLRTYAARIIADRPLRTSTLQRNLLLMRQIPGLTVGSALHPIPGQPGAERLVLGILRKPIEGGIGINNQGTPLLDVVQTTANLTVNGLLRQGEQDQLVFGAPLTFRRYQYFGYSHREPIGDNGASVTFSIGDLITHPVGEVNSGTAQIASLRFSDPLILGVTRSLVASVEADYLNSASALFGTTVSDERTRVLRAGLAYSRAGDWNGIDALDVTASEGFSLLGARQANAALGGPAFAKLDVAAVRLQALPWGFVATLRASGQVTPDHLPASEQFLVGGPVFGQAFDAGALAGDDGLAFVFDLAHPIPSPLPPAYLAAPKVFVFADWGRIWNVHTPYEIASDTGASAGAGVSFTLLRKLHLKIGVATPLDRPREVASIQRWKFLFAVAGRF